MIPPTEFFELPWYKNAERRAGLRRDVRAVLKPTTFDNLQVVYVAASLADREALRAKFERAPEPLRAKVLAVFAAVDGAKK